ncbi:hypothetical protein Tco_1404283 [Tanacetum coccineum]
MLTSMVQKGLFSEHNLHHYGSITNLGRGPYSVDDIYIDHMLIKWQGKIANLIWDLSCVRLLDDKSVVTSSLAVQPTSSYPSITIEGLVVLNIVQSLTNLNLNYKAYTEKKLSGILALNYRKNISAAIFKKLVKDYPVS